MNELINKLSLVIILGCGYYCILTLPVITKFLFDFGLNYPMWLIITCSVVSGVLSNITVNKLLR